MVTDVAQPLHYGPTIDIKKGSLLGAMVTDVAQPPHYRPTIDIKYGIVSVHFNHFHCMGICNKLSRHLSMLTYIYLNVDEC